jgi:hypothetical protein
MRFYVTLDPVTQPRHGLKLRGIPAAGSFHFGGGTYFVGTLERISQQLKMETVWGRLTRS